MAGMVNYGNSAQHAPKRAGRCKGIFFTLIGIKKLAVQRIALQLFFVFSAQFLSFFDISAPICLLFRAVFGQRQRVLLAFHFKIQRALNV